MVRLTVPNPRQQVYIGHSRTSKFKPEKDKLNSEAARCATMDASAWVLPL